MIKGFCVYPPVMGQIGSYPRPAPQGAEVKAVVLYGKGAVIAPSCAGEFIIEALAPGLWEVAIEARADGELVYAERRRIHVARAGG